MPKLPIKPNITVDGSLSDWISAERIDYGDVPGYSFYSDAQGDYFYFALSGSAAIGPNSTFWFNTDLNSATGYQIFGFAGGAEFNLNIASNGTAALYSGGAGQTLVLSGINLAYSTDHQTIEFAIPKTALGSPNAIDILYDVNDNQFGPLQYSAPPYIAFTNNATRTDPSQRIGIVFSQTTADHYFSVTAYSQLFMAVQSQAMQAGISFDLLTEADLTDINKLANYDALVFPSFSNVQASQVDAITNTLLQATRQFGVGLITAGNFLTNDETGAPLAGDSYARMKLLLDATRVTGGFPADVTINSSDVNHTVLTTLDNGALIHSYSQVGWDAFQSVSGNGQTIATETVGGQTYSAALATQTGGKNVLFSTPGVMADNNLLWQAIDYVAKDPGVQVSLDLTRFAGIVASRTDMDQAMEIDDVHPEDGGPGIYDKLLPILAQWKQQFNFVGSYYVDIGNDPANGEYTDWTISAPYYAQILALGNELGTHSYTHPEDTNVLTDAQIQFEFEQSRLLLEQQMSAYLGTPFKVTGAAVPGAPESLQTAQKISQYFDYITGGYSSVGAGYPGAFGYLTPGLSQPVYLAPNTSFDFTLAEFQNLGAAAVELAWANEWNQLVANAQTPIVLWPWHDYGAAQWPTSPPAPSPYTQEMFTHWIERAYNSGAEFVTEADLASRIKSFDNSGVTSTVNGNVIDVTVNSAHAGDFALNFSGLGSQVIENVAGWYAYDNDSLFLPETGGSFAVTLAGAADDVTHITLLPMRGDLLSVTGDGVNLNFSMLGEGDVIIDLGPIANRTPLVTGATISSLVGDQLDITLAGLGVHDVQLRLVAPLPAEVVSAVQFSADTGLSSTDFVTNTSAQIILGSLSAALGAGNVVKVSLDNGATWLTATALPGDTSFSLAGVTLTGSGTLIARVENADGIASAALTQAYVLDQVPPSVTATIVAMTNDSGIAGDFITSDGEAGRIVSGTLSTVLAAEETLQVSSDGGATWTSAAVTGTTWSAPDSAVHTANWTIEARIVDLAGNPGSVSSQPVAFDSSPPAPPSQPDLTAASDSGLLDTDNVTSIATPTVTGTAEADSMVTLLDGTTAIGTSIAAADGSWLVTVGSALTEGVHSIQATATDAAGNVGAASSVLSITIDKTAPAAPSMPDLIVSSDSGASNTDDLTNIIVPTFTGTAEAGSTVTLLDGAAVIGTSTATAAGDWSIVASTLADGNHSISATAKDDAGNISAASSTLAVTIDAAAPAAPTTPDLVATSDTGVSDTDNITNVNTPIFTGTAEAGATVTLFNGATNVGSGVAAADGVWTITSSVLGNGTVSISAKATDVAGNVGVASQALSVTIDATAPAAPSAPDLVAASDSGVSSTDNLTNITTPSFTGNAVAGSTVTLFDGATVIGTGTATGGTWTIVASPLADGAHSITARAADASGNSSAASPALAMTIDTTAPAVSTPDMTVATDKGVSNTDNITNDNTPNFTGTAEAGSTITLLDGAAVIGTGTATAAGAWTIVASALADGNHSISATAKDRAGNISAASSALPVTIDVTAPAAPTTPDLVATSDTGLSDTDNITSLKTPTFTGTAEAGATVTLFNGAAKVGTGVAGADGVWTITSSALAIGTRSISAKATDVAGNLGVASSVLAVVIDAAVGTPTRPDLLATSDSGVSGTDNLTNIATPSFTGKAEAGSTVTLLDGATVIGSGVATGGIWTIVASPLADGAHSITAQAVDASGNSSAASPALVVTMDTAAPSLSTPDMTAATDKGASNTDNITNDNTPTFTGTAEAGSTVTLLDGVAVIGTGTATAAGAWTIVASALTDGNHSISATAKDRAGNISAASSALPVTIDAAAPAAPTTPDLVATSDTGVSDTDNITSLKTPTFTGTAEAGTIITLFNGAAKVGTGVAAEDGVWTITSSALANGAHSITVKATDTAGNVGVASSALAVVIDATVGPPTRPDLVAASDSGVSSTDNLTNIKAPSFTGTAEAGSIVTLFDGATAIGSGTAAGGTWTIVASPLADGAHNITAKAVDASGNSSAASAALAVTLDTQAPNAPTIAAGSATTLTGKGDATTVVSVSDGTSTVGTATVGPAGNWAMSFIAGASPRTLTAVATDRAGNPGAIADTRVLVGTSGSNTLSGTGGNELFIGAGSSDTFSFDAAFGQDIIADFVAGGAAHDIIKFSGSGALNSFENVLSHTTAAGTGVVISDASNTLTLNNVSKTSLTSADFNFA